MPIPPDEWEAWRASLQRNARNSTRGLRRSTTRSSSSIRASASARPSRPPPPPGGWPDADAILDELNNDNSVVMIGARTRVLRFEHTPHVAEWRTLCPSPADLRALDDFRNLYLNRLIFTAQGPVSIGQWWLEHPKHKHYRGVIFLPGGPPVVDDRLNLWTGFAVNPKQGKWERSKTHIFEVLAARDDAVYDYTHNWMADAVQHPDRQAEVALVYLGGQGTGKA